MHELGPGLTIKHCYRNVVSSDMAKLGIMFGTPKFASEKQKCFWLDAITFPCVQEARNVLVRPNWETFSSATMFPSLDP